MVVRTLSENFANARVSFFACHAVLPCAADAGPSARPMVISPSRTAQ
jgi:hypothetical protein